MNKMYGKLELVDNKWQMSNVPPHVAIRLKQLFPRIPKLQTGIFTFPYDNNHCADLTWFLQRYPMEMKNDDRSKLNGGKSLFEVNQARMEEILRPDYSPPLRVGLKDGQAIRLYQAQAIDICLARGSLLLGDDVGLGKTYTTTGMLLDPKALPAAVIVQTHLQGQWKKKIEQFTYLRAHKIKTPQPYDLPHADIYIYKYSQLLGWIDTFEDGFFKAVAFDEVQELRTGLKSGKGSAAKRLSDSVQYRIGLSATPIYNYGSEIWNIMQYIDPSILGTREEFIREWCIDDRQVRDPDALGTFLREQNVMIRRTKRDVGQLMPTPNVIIEHVDADQGALRSIEDLARQLAFRTTIGSFMERGRAGMELDLLMRQATGIAKAKGVAQYVKLFLEAGMPVMLGGWHRAVYDIWLKELAQFNPVMYTGSETDFQKLESVRKFTSGESNLFIMSLRSGAGLDGLQHRCSTVLVGELDWSPKVIEQFVGRVFREGQQEQVDVIYLNTDEGSDPPIVEMLGIKSSQSSGIVDPGRQFEAKHSNKSRIKALAEKFLNKIVISEEIKVEHAELQTTLF